MKRSVLVGFVVSLLVHGLLALGLVVYFEYAPGPDVLATLDLSSVELSFAEKVEESAAVAAMSATPPAKSQPPPQPVEPPRPQAEKAPPLPPDPAAPKFREPKEEPWKLEDVRRETKDAKEVRRETKDEKAKDARHETKDVPTVAPRQARVDAPPRPRRSIRPDYPKGARQRGEQGDVTLEIRVNAAGAVDRVTVVVPSGFADLDAAAVKAAKAAKFTPAKSGREAVASTARLTLSFKLK